MSTVGGWRCSSLAHSPALTTITNIRQPSFRAAYDQFSLHGSSKGKKKVVVVGSGWAGLAAAHHLSKQGLEVTVLETACSVDVGVNGFRYSYRNIFSLIDELNIKPLTNWMKSAFYSPQGIEVEVPIYQNLPKLPAPFGALFYTQYPRLPIFDRITAFLFLAAVIDFDNTDGSWRKYDLMIARELLKDYGCSEKLYREVLSPIVQVGLSAPPEQCSAAATLGMLYYFILAHQQDLDIAWCRGKVDEKIFKPWVEVIKSNNGVFVDKKMVTDFSINEDTGSISEVLCEEEKYPVDAVVLAVGVPTLQNIIQSSPVLQTRQEFLKVMHLAATDMIYVKLVLNKKVKIPNANNIFIGSEDLMVCAFLDLNAIYDEYKDSPVTILEAFFHKASQLLPLKDDQIVAMAISHLSKCIEELQNCAIKEYEVTRSPKSALHFFPGSYKYMMRGSTSFPNLFMAGDWIMNRHGSWLQEKAYVTGLEASNRVIDILEEGEFAKIIAVEEDEPHIQALRGFNRYVKEIKTQIPFYDYFL